jgi:ferredoxin
MKGKTMADRNDKVKDNVEGAYYVDCNCIDCDLCRSMAPEFFGRSEEQGLSLVTRQPQTEAERRLCEESLVVCPVDAIGNDGEDVE